MANKRRKDSNASPSYNSRPEFSLKSLSAAGGIEAAIRALVLGYEGDDELRIRWDVEILSRELTRAPDVLVVLLSSNHDMRSFFSGWILDQFPSDPGKFSTSSQRSVLDALVNVIGKIAPPWDVDQSLFKEHLRTVPLVTQALQSLEAMRFDDDSEPYTPVIPELNNTRKRQKTSRQQKRESVRATQKQLSDAKALEALYVELPTSQEGWTLLSKDFLDSQCDSLQFLIDILGIKGVQAVIFEFVLKVVQAPVEALPVPRPQRCSEAVGPVPENNAEEFQSEKMRYPTISPDKARHSFEWPAEFGEWNIYISSTAIKHLRQFRRADKSTFKIIQEKIIQLSEGFFSGSNQKRLEGAPNDVPIYEAKMTGDLRLVYQIDIAVDYEAKVDKQIIRIHGIYTHAQFDHRLWSRVAQTIRRVDGAYRSMINYRVQPRQVGVGANNVTPPQVWPHSDNNFKSTIIGAESASALSEDQCLELHKILSLEKFIPYSAAVLNTILQDIDAVHPFFVSQAEMKIIQHPSSCFVIGRSGTGKTTTMVFKLLRFEEARRQSGFLGGSGQIRQVFLTQSHVLASKVEEYYLQLLEATQLGSALVSGIRRVKLSEKHLTELDEEADDRPDLPERFSELKDEHFPLFLTYDQLRRMLETEYDVVWHRSASHKTKAPATTPQVTKQKNLTDLIANDTWDSSDSSPDARRGHSGLVTFEAFKAHYWSHMDQRQIKGLDPAQVLSEIIGVICGHKDTMKTNSGYLTREAYTALSHRSHSAFASDRSRIYDMFERYHRLKIANNAFDTADRTHKILRKVDPKLANIDFLYVDEVQDLLTVDTKLLRDLCPNPRGHFWGGDTAQTISVGSSFRFEDLKDLVYQEELNDPLVKRGARQAVKSEVFELLVNYRSHGGIVECAASIIDLLSTMFPYSIDKLQREASIVAGPKPRVFREKLVHWEQFLCGPGDTRLDFGARQVIIVRNDEARDEVRAALGDEGLVLTLLESKGLEFDDVLLYNFFGSSPASPAQWRVIQSKNADPVKHRVIESELKRLYVAVTRARHHIWLWDSSDVAAPMLNHWISLDLVKIHGPSEPFPQLATTSTVDEWYSTGRTLFSRSLFAQAASCFEKAQRPHDRDMALAYQRRKDARSLQPGDQRFVAFNAAGSAFETCAQLPSVGALALRRRAGECFVEGGDYASAGINFEAAGCFTDAALNYHKAQRLDDAARLVRPPDGTPSLVKEPICGKILDSVKLQFLRLSNIERAGPLFDSADEEVEFVNDYLHERSDLAAAIYKQKGEYIAAAKILSRDGQHREAAECWVLSGRPEAQQHAANFLLWELWNIALFVPDVSSLRESVDLLSAIPRSSLSEACASEVDMFRAIIMKDQTSLFNIGRDFKGKNPVALILSFSEALRYPFDLKSTSLTDLSFRLSVVDAYCQHLMVLLRRDRLCDFPDAAKLFGFHQSVDVNGRVLQDVFRVAPGSHTSRMLAGDRAKGLNAVPSISKNDARNVRGDALNNLLRWDLEEVIWELLCRLHFDLTEAVLLKPCLEFKVLRECKKTACTRLHETAPNLDMYFRVHMQIVVALENLWYIPHRNPGLRRDVQRIWVERIYSVLFPLARMCGDSNLVRAFPEAHRALPLVRNWIEQRARDLSPSHHTAQARFTTDAVMLVMMGHVFHGRQLPAYFWHDLPMFHSTQWLFNPLSRSSYVNDMTYLFVTQAQVPIAQGASFFGWAAETCPSIDLNVLVHYLEQLSLRMIFEFRRARQDSYHNLLLPRSWAIMMTGMTAQGPNNFVNIHQLLSPVMNLLQTVNNWNGYGKSHFTSSGKPIFLIMLLRIGSFTFQGRQFPTSWALRQEILARICRAVVLVGFNRPTSAHQWPGWIFNAITKSFDPERSHGNLYSRAKEWWDLVKALAFYGTQDNLVLLYRKSFKATTALAAIPRLEFTDLDDLKSRLTERFRESPVTVTTVDALPATIAEQNEDVADEAPPGTEELLEAEEPFTQPIVPGDPEVIKATRTDDGLEHVVTLIQHCYRRYRARRRLIESYELHKIFDECAKDAQQLVFECSKERKHRYYYTSLVQGPLPHVLLVLSRMLVLVRSAKDAATLRLDKAKSGADIDRGMERVRVLRDAYKAILELQESIGPGSKTFRSGDSAELKKHVEAAKGALEASKSYLKTSDIEELEKDMAIGIKGIITPPSPPKRKDEKPSLNTEDI
ncbi:uncharacterized protein EI90DRAFT_3119273 [Cantharellus anzutake]|uniref:uncharacterized protein n=1 Tax=Cantharellus anzutake TaxID=1750568 RepID=UPI001904D8B4|nr:uncharacterized protein EI90DRAFT_3119273 [Cantharellus anzutake]KAF8336973.1 hypothetical protein EI90DRAFT_3119273 [Cantharellus anzutake]